MGRREHPGREDARYLELRRKGKSYRDIALLCGVSYRTAWNGVQAAKKRQKAAAEPAEIEQARHRPDPAWVRDTVPLFPIDSFTRESKCPHSGPIQPGSLFCCMVCHQSGKDAHPALRIDPAAAPRPEPKPTTAPLTRESKKQRRKREAVEKAKARKPRAA